MDYSVADADTVLRRAGAIEDQYAAAHLQQARQLLSASRRLVVSRAEEYVGTMASALERYDGMPVEVNPLEIVGAQEAEVVHTQVLAWLLDPKGSHGLQDSLLRELLSTGRTTAARRLAGKAEPLQALVRAECVLPSGICDIVVATEGVLLGVECKIWAEEHLVEFESGESLWQCSAYRRQLEDPGVQHWLVDSLGPRLAALLGPRPSVEMVFIRPRGRPAARDAKTESTDWIRIDTALATACRRHAPAGPARTMIGGFRSTLLESSGSTPPFMPMILEARCAVDHPGIRQFDPLGVYLRFRELAQSLSESANG